MGISSVIEIAAMRRIENCKLQIEKCKLGNGGGGCRAGPDDGFMEV
jgi:hypothetical protein